MGNPGTAIVTGAFSYTGSAVARSLLAQGFTVRTLTNRRTPVGDPGGVIESCPLRFDDPGLLTEAMRGARVFVNTYWVRYPYVGVGFDQAVRNTGILLRSAREAGVERVVHVSVSNPSLDSPLAYYRGKAETEELVRNAGISYAIVRPTLVVGPHDILINNIGWFLRRLPIFGMPGSGGYRVQPVLLDDVGGLVGDAAMSRDNLTLDAAGPEIITFETLVRAVATGIGRRPRIVHLPPPLVLAVLRVVGWAVREVILSGEELRGLMDELLVSRQTPTGTRSVLAWLRENGRELGRDYASELKRHGRGR